VSLELLTAIALGIALSVCAGFRAIVPLFVLGLGHRFAPGVVPLPENVSWLGSTPALVALGAAAFVETLADKIPVVDHALDLVQTPVRSLAGAAVFAAPFADFPSWVIALVALIGGASALSVHGAKSGLRAASTALTFGLANPLISLVEDIVTWLLAILAVLLPLIAGALVLIFLVWLFRSLRRRLANASSPEIEAKSAAKEGAAQETPAEETSS